MAYSRRGLEDCQETVMCNTEPGKHLVKTSINYKPDKTTFSLPNGTSSATEQTIMEHWGATPSHDATCEMNSSSCYYYYHHHHHHYYHHHHHHAQRPQMIATGSATAAIVAAPTAPATSSTSPLAVAAGGAIDMHGQHVLHTNSLLGNVGHR